ncbi:NUDIX domain-containing protein [Candidatus Frankia nodulisporulans]|uniref:NUDIX domain-containing protein n=1 Tax=Candidatus Frankia nodulisporulans TaxID=2060052 RepID=UPI0013D78E25|nr:NUDIX hydrolase [Candidatus Frankia nodulisporulans]
MTDIETIEMARLTADVIALAVHDGTLHVLLIRRRRDPFAGMWAFPGGHVDPGETVDAAARRELAEETGMTVGDLTPVGVYTAPGRDPRGRYVTAVFTSHVDGMPTPTAADDADAARWVPVDEALADGLAFDHTQILRDAVTR